ncbi:MAG TPA: glycosyltransferase family 1 protein [Steroidobacteraceae bacterium]|nr:glycosyltransferase family 1 protein [Steroidobacteraceae bacterium]
MWKRTIGVMARLLDQHDGIGIYGLNLLRELLALDPATRYVVFLQTAETQDQFAAFRNADVQVLPARSKLYWDQVAVPLAARRARVDLIFNPKFSIPFRTNLPCVFVQQGSDWYVNPGNYAWWDKLYIRLMLPLYSRKAARTLSISQATLDDLARYTNIDVSTSVVSYAGVGSNFTPERDPAALARFQAQHRLPERFILTVARTLHGAFRNAPAYPGGNTERLVRGYRKYRQQGGELPLVVAGKRIEEYLRSQGFSDADLADVRFIGFVPNTELHLAYQLADCFITATLCESFGIPIVEALATGCPAIVPTTCASPEVAGGAARLIDPRDEGDIAAGLAEVTGSETLRREMREKGLRRAQALTWRRTAERTLEVFDELVPLARSPAQYRVAN